MIPLILLLFPSSLAVDVDLNETLSSSEPLSDYALSSFDVITQYLHKSCGPLGWCAFRCCPGLNETPFGYGRLNPSFFPASLSRPRYYSKPLPSAYSLPVARYPKMVPPVYRRPEPICPRACMPDCLPRCLRRYDLIVASFMRSLTSSDIQSIEEGQPKTPFLVEEEEQVCRADCMPLCTLSCLLDERVSRTEKVKTAPAKQCKPMCMPACSDDCVYSPPLMVSCIFDKSCICPAGYVQCSESTCCMRYRTMAVRYRNRLSSFAFEDDGKKREEGEDVKGGNQMSHYMKTLRKMGGTEKKSRKISKLPKELPKNGTVIYYPEEKKAEIIYNDGEIFVEHMKEKP